HDPGVDAVGAHEDAHALLRLMPARIGGNRAEDEGGEQIEQRNGEQCAADPADDAQPTLHEWPARAVATGRLGSVAPSPSMGEGWGGGGVSAGTALFVQRHPHPTSPIEGEELHTVRAY